MDITPIILAGGEGTRLFPIATPLRPKPFVPLAGGFSLLARSLQRVIADGFTAPIIVGNAMHRFALLNHARDAGVLPAGILLEETAHNTAMAVALAVAAITDDAAMLAFLPADHVIADDKRWCTSIRTLAATVQDGSGLGLMGHVTHAHNPELGYLVVTGSEEVQAVQRFIEKPAHPVSVTGEERTLCNLGQFIGRRDAFVRSFQTHAPALWESATTMVSNAHMAYEFTCFPAAPNDTVSSAFDRLVLEKTTRLWAVGCDIGWEDLGSTAAWGKHQGNCPIAPPRVDRPWGHYTTCAQSESRVEKKLLLYPDCRISLQRHHHRDEYWEIIAGTADVTCDGHTRILHAGDAITIPKKAWHRLKNVGEEVLLVKEIQTGQPTEGDIERKEDDYGRF